MKDVEEYNHNDLEGCLNHAEQIAMGAIEYNYHHNKDDEEVCIETIHSVKKAMQVLEMVHRMRAITKE